MTDEISRERVDKYPWSIRIFHWLRALLILGLLVTGWYMTRLPESSMDTASFLYFNHKQFGILVWLSAVVHLALRWRYNAILPHAPLGDRIKLWGITRPFRTDGSDQCCLPYPDTIC